MPESVVIKDLKLDDVISHIHYGTAIVPDVTDGTVIGFSAGSALRNPATAATNHANVYPALPVDPQAPVLDDYTSYDYLVLRLTDTSIIEIGIPWIQESSLSRLLRKTALVTIDDFDESRLAALNEVLSVNGFLDVTITIS